MNRGQRARIFCFDCGRATAATVQVWRNADGTPIDWANPKTGTPDGPIGTYVCRAGTGCNLTRTSGEVRTSPAFNPA